MLLFTMTIKRCSPKWTAKKLNATKVVGCDGKLMVKYSIMTIQVNLQCLMPGIGPKSTWTVIKILPSTHHHSHFSSTWNPQPFHTINFKKATFFLQQHCFWADITSICTPISLCFALQDLDDAYRKYWMSYLTIAEHSSGWF